MLLATGGAGRIYQASTNAFINTGDGLGMAARAGIPLEDMEFWQFHPTGVAGAGVLLTEGCRGEGAILRNSDGERFMERYAPTLKDLAPRDFVSRCMDQEIKEGRGCGPQKDHIVLDMTHLGGDTIRKRLPSVLEIGHNFANVDITREPIPVVPTIHYQMGGVPTNVHGQVVAPRKAIRTPGWRACTPRECSCVAACANRWARIRLDLIVLGRSAGNTRRQPVGRASSSIAGAASDSPSAPARSSEHGRRVRQKSTTTAQSMQAMPACSAPARWTTAGPGQGDCRARQVHPSRRQVERVQHRARRGARGRQPDGIGARDDGLRGGTARVPRRAQRRRLRAADRRPRVAQRARRHPVAEAHPLVQRRQPPRLQAGEPDAADGRVDPAQVRRSAAKELEDETHLKIYATPRTARASMQSYEVALDATSAL